MFTVKFMQINNEYDPQSGTSLPLVELETCICCNHYEACKKPYGWDIITYQDMTDCEGTERQVTREQMTSDHKVYNVCYVENDKGQTINSYRC